MAGYLIAVVAFALPLAFGATGLGRPRMVLGVGAVLTFGWLISLAADRAEDARGEAVIPLWLLGGLVVLLYAIWCGGFWLGLRLRRLRTR
jgi:type VI protein secretion system component VasK